MVLSIVISVRGPRGPAHTLDLLGEESAGEDVVECRLSEFHALQQAHLLVDFLHHRRDAGQVEGEPARTWVSSAAALGWSSVTSCCISHRIALMFCCQSRMS